MWAARLGYEVEEDGSGDGLGDGRGTARGVTAAGRAGDEARERTAALDTLIDILSRQLASDAGLEAGAYLAELDRRRAAEREGSADGVNLLTYHRAKGLEWDAVALPMLEDGSLPIRQALDDEALLEEERRLFYVGLTRARDHLAISWAAERETRGRTSRRTRAGSSRTSGRARRIGSCRCPTASRRNNGAGGQSVPWPRPVPIPRTMTR